MSERIDLAEVDWPRIQWEVEQKLRAIEHASLRLHPDTARQLLLPVLVPLVRFLSMVKIDGDGSWPDETPESCEVIEVEPGHVRIKA
jgi:hypothetical protein